MENQATTNGHGGEGNGRFEPLPRLLLRAYRAADEALGKDLAAVGPADVTPATWEVLAILPDHGVRAVDVARRLGMTKQAVGQVLQELEEQGLVERTRDPSDRRARLVRLTAGGRALVDHGEDALRAREDAWADELGVSRLLRLRRTLDELAELVSGNSV